MTSIKVICVETGEVFPTLNDAMRSSGLTSWKSFRAKIDNNEPINGKRYLTVKDYEKLFGSLELPEDEPEKPEELTQFQGYTIGDKVRVLGHSLSSMPFPKSATIAGFIPGSNHPIKAVGDGRVLYLNKGEVRRCEARR